MADEADGTVVQPPDRPAAPAPDREQSTRVAEAVARWRQMQSKLDELDIKRLDPGLTPVGW